MFTESKRALEYKIFNVSKWLLLSFRLIILGRLVSVSVFRNTFCVHVDSSLYVGFHSF